MSYTNHFQLADIYISHTNTIVNNVSDPFIKQRYTGFIFISAVTVYELAIKDIFINFAHKKHKVLGNVIENIYESINGRISLKDLKKIHIVRFGDKYLKKFEKKLNAKESEILYQHRRSVKSSYGNIITWRNKFVHQGYVPSNATYNEAVNAYEDGKEIIHILANSMIR